MKLTRMSIDWVGFHMSRHVKDMPALTKGIYLLALGEFWMNGGWLPNDDRIIAKRLGMDVREWRKHRRLIEPCLTEVSEKSPTLPAGMLVQDRLSREYAHTLELVEKKQQQTAPARAKRLAKSKQAASVTEQPEAAPTETVTAPVTEPVSTPVTQTATDGEAEAEKKEALLPNSRELLSSALTVEDTALPPRENGHAGGSADVGSPGLGGRSPPQPSEKKIEVSDALLRTPLVKKARTGLMAALDSEEDD